LDNAPQESFFGHLKDHLKLSPTDTHDDAAIKIADCIDYYNNDRYQWKLTKLASSEFYKYLTTNVYLLPAEALNTEKEDGTMPLAKPKLLKMAHSLRIGLTLKQISAILERFSTNDEYEWTEQDIAEQVRNYCLHGVFEKPMS
jgi:hypothetical protein